MPATMLPGTYPFWFWNDRLDHDELRRQVAEMAAQGFRGFYIHSRQGLATPYLSDAFMRCVEVVIEAAAEHDMQVQLYDEYPYPSGVAGGEVVLGEPRYMATRLTQQQHRLQGGAIELPLPPGRVLDCQAFPITPDGRLDTEHARDLRSAIGMRMDNYSFVVMGLTAYNQKRFFASDPRPVLQAELPAGEWCVVASLQTLVEDHKYWKFFADIMNSEVVQRWLEVTHQRYADRLGDQLSQAIGSIFVDETTPGWSALLPAAWAERYGEPLEPLLPALLLAEHPRHLETLARYRDLTLARFVESFEKPVAAWCREHGIRYAGEKNNLRLSQLRYLDLPGCEPGHTKAGAPPDYHSARIRSNARATASAAWFYEKEGALCECFHSLGWSGTMQDARVIAEGLVQQGIRYLVPHGAFYSTHALRKHDGPPSFYMQMPYWPLYGMLQQRVQRLFDATEGFWIDAQIVVCDPNPGLPSEAHMAAFQELLLGLVRSHRDYHIVDTDILEVGTIDSGRVHLRGISPTTVIMPPGRRPEPAMTAWLERFTEAGGQVLRFQDAGEVAELLERLPPPTLQLTGTHADGVQTATWTDGRRRRWIVLNVTDSEVDATFQSATPLRELPLDAQAPPRLRADGRRRIAPFESLLLEAAEAPDASPALPELRLAIAGGQPCRVQPHAANLLRLDDWQMQLGDADATYAVHALPIANQLQESGAALSPTVQTYFGQMPTLELPPLRITYSCAFTCAYAGAVALVMEPGSLVGEWRCRVNDGAWLGKADFAPSEAHVRGSLAHAIHPYLQPGENTLTVELRTDQLDGGLLNPLYLAGDFAVDAAKRRLHQRSAAGGFEAYADNGLPCYSGVIDYALEVPMTPPTGADELLLWLDLPSGFEDACELQLNGHDWVPLPWSPRVARVPAAWLRDGKNAIVVRVSTSLIRAFEGQYFDRAAHAYRPV